MAHRRPEISLCPMWKIGTLAHTAAHSHVIRRTRSFRTLREGFLAGAAHKTDEAPAQRGERSVRRASPKPLWIVDDGALGIGGNAVRVDDNASRVENGRRETEARWATRLRVGRRRPWRVVGVSTAADPPEAERRGRDGEAGGAAADAGVEEIGLAARRREEDDQQARAADEQRRAQQRGPAADALAAAAFARRPPDQRDDDDEARQRSDEDAAYSSSGSVGGRLDWARSEGSVDGFHARVGRRRAAWAVAARLARARVLGGTPMLAGRQQARARGPQREGRAAAEAAAHGVRSQPRSRVHRWVRYHERRGR